MIKQNGIEEERWLRSLIYPINDFMGGLKNFVIIHEDITET